MPTYTVTLTPRQDAALTYAATKRGKTTQQVVDTLVDAALLRILAVYDQDDGGDVQRAYTAATPAKQAAIKQALSLP